MKSSLFLGIFAIVMIAVSCTSEKHYKISGTVEGGDNVMVYLQKQIGVAAFTAENECIDKAQRSERFHPAAGKKAARAWGRSANFWGNLFVALVFLQKMC